MTDRQTIEVYNAKTREYADTVRKAGPDATLRAFIAQLPAGSRILDLGCGLGNSSAAMQEAGHIPDPLDASEEMVRYARDTYSLPARHGDFHDLAGPYGAAWANFSLLHMPRAEIAPYLGKLARHIEQGGLLHIGMKSGRGEKRDTIGRKYSYVMADEMADWLRAAGFEPEEPETGETLGLDGVAAPFFTLTAIKQTSAPHSPA
ncbi:MAG: class I SAM-dependent methyltransferase [Pseudomonadota bacterium]